MRSGLALVVVALAVACTATPTTTASAQPSASSGGGDALAQARARGSLIAVVRVVASPGGQQVDVAHSQKRALETAIATELARRILGPAGKVQFVELGRDRWNPLEAGTADIAMISAADAPSPNVVLTPPYAAGGVVMAVRRESTATDPRSLSGQTIAATTMGELNAADVAQAYLKDQAVTATLAPFPGLAAAVAALDSKQAAAVVGDRTGIEVLQRGRTEPLRLIADIASRPYVIAVRKDAVALHTAITAALKDLIASGEIQKMATAAAFPYQAP